MAGPTLQAGQYANAVTSSIPTAQPVLPNNGTVGNTWYAMTIAPTANMSAYPTTGQNGWTRITGYQNGASGGCTIEMWYLAATATKTPPVINSSYNSFENFVVLWEVVGVPAVDTTSMGEVASAGGTSGTITPGVNSTLVLGTAAADFASYPTIATTGGWTQNVTTGGPYMVSQADAAMSALDMVIGASSGEETTYGMISLKSGSSTETANPVKLALSGVSFNGGGARTETANPATLALGGIKYTAAAQFIAESGAASLVLGGVAFKINTVDVTAEPSLVNFYTF